MDVCRICFYKNPIKSLSDLTVTENDKNVFYIEIMMFCLGIAVKKDSNIGEKLCVKCFTKILEFYDFKKLALQNEAHLSSIISCHDSLHEDDADEVQREETCVVDDVKEEKMCHDIKIEIVSASSDTDQETIDIVHDVKVEELQESESDDEYLSVIKKSIPVSKEKAPSEKKSKHTTTSKEITRTKKYKVPPKKVCIECGKTVKDIKYHAVQHLPPELRPKLKCEYCDKVFTYKHTRLKHVKNVHIGSKKKCSICSKEVISLNEHMAMHNPEDKRHQCVLCNSRFISQSRLKDHMKNHTTDLPFECDVCNKKFRRKAEVAKHRRFIHEEKRPCVCKYCFKSYAFNSALQDHLRTHTNEKPFKCEKCGKCFSTAKTRNKHEIIHSTEKKFACTLCDKSFVLHEYLKAHMLSHTKEKKFPCQYCGVKFQRSGHRKRHEFTAHLKNMTDNQ